MDHNTTFLSEQLDNSCRISSDVLYNAALKLPHHREYTDLEFEGVLDIMRLILVRHFNGEFDLTLRNLRLNRYFSEPPKYDHA